MHYVNAAHCPPVLIRPGADLVEFEASAMPVGLMEAAEYPVIEQQLLPGDKVVIYSDGVTEAQNTQEKFFGKKRLREIIEASAGAGCCAIHDAIQDAVRAFTEGAAQSDDITVLVLEFRGSV
jgi:sigma-B regulation protein RsbU (phosphoserine phosphatase)